jgi:hypothetical protein
VITLKKITINDVDIEYIEGNVTATLAIEGIKPSEEAVTINRMFLEGKITSKEAVRRIKAKYLDYIRG